MDEKPCLASGLRAAPSACKRLSRVSHASTIGCLVGFARALTTRPPQRRGVRGFSGLCLSCKFTQWPHACALGQLHGVRCNHSSKQANTVHNCAQKSNKRALPATAFGESTVGRELRGQEAICRMSYCASIHHNNNNNNIIKEKALCISNNQTWWFGQ